MPSVISNPHSSPVVIVDDPPSGDGDQVMSVVVADVIVTCTHNLMTSPRGRPEEASFPEVSIYKISRWKGLGLHEDNKSRNLDQSSI